MKMKSKKCQRRNTPFNRSYSDIFVCSAYVLFTICVLESLNHQSHVDAYITNARNATNLYEPFDIQYLNSSSSHSKKVLSRDRNGRFLFDMVFGIDTPPLDAADLVEDDDDDEEDLPKPCKCGRYYK